MKTALRFHIRKEVCNHERDVWHNLIHAEEVKKSAQTHDHQVLDGEHCRILVSDIEHCHVHESDHRQWFICVC